MNTTVHSAQPVSLYFDSYEDVLVEISDFNMEVEIVIHSNSQNGYRVPSFNELILTKILYLPQSRNQHQITITPMYQSENELRFKHKVISLEGMGHLQPLFQQLENIYNSSNVSNAHNKQHKYSCITHVSELDTEEKINNNLFGLYLLKLWEQEDYNTLIRLVESSCLDLNTIVNNQDQIALFSMYARSLLNLNFLEQALDAFSLLTRLLKTLPSSEGMILALAELEGDLGLTKMLLANQQKSQTLLESGKMQIMSALNRLPSNNYSLVKAKLYSNLWSYYGFNNQFQEGLTVIELGFEQLDKIEAKENHPARLVLLSHLSFSHHYSNNISNAIQAQRKIQSLMNSKNKFSQAFSQLNLANLYVQIGNYELAKRYYTQLLPFFIENESPYDVALIYFAMGKIHLGLGEFQTSKESLDKSLSLFTTEFLAERLRAKIAIANYYATVQSIEKARLTLSSIKDESSNQLLDMDKIQFLLVEGKLLEIENSPESHREILNFIIDNFQFEDLEISQKISFFEQHIANLSHFELLADTNRAFENTLAFIQKIRQELYVIYAGETWVNHTNKLIQKYASFLYKQYEKEQDTKWLERLFEVLESNYAINTVQQRNLIKERFHTSELPTEQFKAYLNAEKSMLQATNESELTASISKRDLTLEILKANENFSLRNLSFSFEPMPLLKMSNRLKSNEMIIRYFFINNSLKAFLIDSNGWSVHDYSHNFKRQDLDESVSVLEPHRLSENNLLIRHFDGLIPSMVTQREEIQKLIILPVDSLNRIPFAAIHIGEQNSRYKPVSESLEIIRVNNLTRYLEAEVELPNASEFPDITIFADPNFTSNSLEVKTQFSELQRSWIKGLSRLPASLKEAEYITTLFPSNKVTTYLGDNATTANLMSIQSRSSNILHIASHGFFSEVTPDLVGIVTSKQFDDVDSTGFGFLSLRELISKPFLARLVVVSGCETGMGEVVLGEGMISLSTGLIRQGAGSVISTLWKIPDKSTALFMKYFYQTLHQNGGNTAGALNQARIKFIRSGRYRHPKYWAGFILTVSNRQYETINFK
jgi:CHAT domain-containing protein/tetratricopeptide (TPR) repeat protein